MLLQKPFFVLQEKFARQKLTNDEISIHTCLEEIKIILGQTKIVSGKLISVTTSASMLENTKDPMVKYLSKSIKSVGSDLKDFEAALLAKKKSLVTALRIVNVQELQFELRSWVAEKNRLRRTKLSGEDLHQLFLLENWLAVSSDLYLSELEEPEYIVNDYY